MVFNFFVFPVNSEFMRLLTNHTHIVSWLLVVFEMLLMAYLAVRCYRSPLKRKNWTPLILLVLLLIWNCLFGYSGDLFVLVNVNTIALIIVVLLMSLPYWFKRSGSRLRKAGDLPDQVEIPEPSDRFMANCRKAGLSSRELEVVLLIRKERKNKEIADELFISERTVEGHLRNIYEKVGCSRSKLSLINKLNS